MKRSEAATKGLKTYVSGNACRKGHTGPRYTSTGNCIECADNNRKFFSRAELNTSRYLAQAGLQPHHVMVHPTDWAVVKEFVDALAAPHVEAMKARVALGGRPLPATPAEEAAALEQDARALAMAQRDGCFQR